MVNPEIFTVALEEAVNEEGCLSLPGHYADVSRPAEAKVRYLDETGTSRQIEADGLLATCIQHEIDHINGILFVDHISSLKRNMILKKMVRAKKDR
jgi:peptide deformylase